MSAELKKVLLITYYWPPSGGAGVQRCLKFARFLPAFGFEPIVVTVMASQASYPIFDVSLEKEVPAALKVFRTPTFEPFNWYKRISGKQQIPFAGFSNEREPGIKEQILRFIRGNFFIPDARVGWNRYAKKQCEKIIREFDIKAIITSSPPHSTQLIGLHLKRKFDLPWVADMRDPWTDIYYYDKLKHTEPAKKLDLAYERRVLENADRVLVVSPFIKRMLSEKSVGIDQGKIRVLPNGYDENDFSDSSSQKYATPTISYTGTITTDYPYRPFLEALNCLIKQNVDFTFRLTGSCPASLLQEFKLALNDKFVYREHVTHAEAVLQMKSSHILFLAIPDVKNNEGILTGKLFEYLASSTPVFLIGPERGDAAAIINECKAGQAFDPATPAAVLANYLITHLLASAQNLNPLVEQYSRKKLTGQLANIMTELVLSQKAL